MGGWEHLSATCHHHGHYVLAHAGVYYSFLKGVSANTGLVSQATLKPSASSSPSCFDLPAWVETVILLEYFIVFLFFSDICFALQLLVCIMKGNTLKVLNENA